MSDGPDIERKPRLAKQSRQERILAEMMATATLRVGDLAADLDVSTETIRRDLFELQERGLLNRTYGGAVRPFAAEPSVTERHRLMVAEREAIAAVTVRFIKPGEVIAIGAGATTTHVAAECRDLKVITHSFSVATVVAANPTIEVIMCPGRYNAREGMMVGVETAEFLESYNVNRAILGISGITPEGLADAEAPAAWVYKAMMKRAAETIVVADHKKFDVQALAIWARIPDIQRLVVDRAPEGAVGRALSRAHVEVSVAGK